MIVGCFGSVVFTASGDTVRTLENLTRTGSARYATHERHMAPALTEFVGLDPEKVTFDITLVRELGVDPALEIEKLFWMMNAGVAATLVVGYRFYGKGRWTITKVTEKTKYTDAAGNPIAATVSVALQEYLWG